jgi:hypothetical protein
MTYRQICWMFPASVYPGGHEQMRAVMHEAHLFASLKPPQRSLCLRWTGFGGVKIMMRDLASNFPGGRYLPR